jgi:hypothetical protein
VIPVRADRLPHVTRVYPDGTGLGRDWEDCPACDLELAGPTALVYIGPGGDPEDQAKARAGRWHTGAAVAVHAACAGVESTEETP